MTTCSPVQSLYKTHSVRQHDGPAEALGGLIRVAPDTRSRPRPTDSYLNLDAGEAGRILPGRGQDQILVYKGGTAPRSGRGWGVGGCSPQPNKLTTDPGGRKSQLRGRAETPKIVAAQTERSHPPQFR